MLAVGGGLLSPARAATTSPERTATPAVTLSQYEGHTDGTVLYADAANLTGATNVAKVAVGQSASGVRIPAPLTAADTTDQLQSPLLNLPKTGKSAYGHGSGLNAGLVQNATLAGQLQQTLAEATSPAPSRASGSAIDLSTQLEPLAGATVLASSAAANTTADGSCVINKDISDGMSQVSNANALETSPTTPVVELGGTSQSSSLTKLVKPSTATGTVVSSANAGLLDQTTQSLAPLTLFAGTPAAITIKVLAPIQLSAEAGGQPGTSVISYGTTSTDKSLPVISITAGGSTQTLSSDQLFGSGGLKLALGAADVTIGTPAHSLTGLEGTSPTTAANGTTASAAADFIRVTVPGTLATSSTGSGGPLGSVLNPVLTAFVNGIAPLTAPIGTALTKAGITAADVRIGHFEAASTVPVGGIVCAATAAATIPNPLGESVKDVSASTVAPGQTFTYDIRVPNRGDQNVTNVVVKDTYASGLEFLSSVPAPVSQSGNVLTYDLGTIAPNEFTTIVLTFRVPIDATAGTMYSNHADITGTYAGLPVAMTVDVSGPTVGAPFAGGCRLTDSTKYASNTQVKTGENFGYFINVLNDGNAACDTVQVNDTLVSGVTFVSCTSSCTHSGQNVSWSLGTLAPGQSEVLAVIVGATATSGTLPNTAHITSTSGGSGNPATPGPTVSGVSVPAPGVPAGCTGNCPSTAVLGNTAAGQLAFTGLSSQVPLLAALLALGGATGLVLRRRRARR